MSVVGSGGGGVGRPVVGFVDLTRGGGVREKTVGEEVARRDKGGMRRPAVKRGMRRLGIGMLVLLGARACGIGGHAWVCGRHVAYVVADHGGDATEKLVAALPGAGGGDGFPGHLVKPADDFLGVEEDVVRLVRHVLGAEEKFCDEDCSGLSEVVSEAPPGGDFVEADGVGLGGNEFEHAASGLDAGCGGGTVKVFGFLRFVGDAVLDAAVAGAVHDDFRGVVEESEGHALAVELLVALTLGEVEDGGEAGAPALELFVEIADDGLNLGPRFEHSGGAVEHIHDVLVHRAEEGKLGKVEGEGWRDISESVN